MSQSIIGELLHNMQESTKDLKEKILEKIREATKTLTRYDKAWVDVPLPNGTHFEEFICKCACAAVNNVMEEINNGRQILFHTDVAVKARYGGASVLNFSIEVHQTAKDEIIRAIEDDRNLETLFETLMVKSAGKQG